MAFNPKDHLIRINGGKMYLPVAYRIVWFREEHPLWTIETHLVDHDRTGQVAWCMAQASIRDEQGRLIASDVKTEDKKGFPDYVEKAFTGAIGRALALCGYGTQFEPQFDEKDDVCDSPQAIPAKQARADEPVRSNSNANVRPQQTAQSPRPPAGTKPAPDQKSPPPSADDQKAVWVATRLQAKAVIDSASKAAKAAAKEWVGATGKDFKDLETTQLRELIVFVEGIRAREDDPAIAAQAAPAAEEDVFDDGYIDPSKLDAKNRDSWPSGLRMDGKGQAFCERCLEPVQIRLSNSVPTMHTNGEPHPLNCKKKSLVEVAAEVDDPFKDN